MPFRGNPFQAVHASILKPQPRAGHQILDGPGDKDFARTGKRCYACTDMDSDPFDFAAPCRDLAFARVKPGSDFNALSPQCIADSAAAADRACRPVEGRQHAIAHEIDLVPHEAFQLMTDGTVVALQLVFPATVAESCGLHC